jgi:hypothetical protein
VTDRTSVTAWLGYMGDMTGRCKELSRMKEMLPILFVLVVTQAKMGQNPQTVHFKLVVYVSIKLISRERKKKNRTLYL